MKIKYAVGIIILATLLLTEVIFQHPQYWWTAIGWIVLAGLWLAKVERNSKQKEK